MFITHRHTLALFVLGMTTAFTVAPSHAQSSYPTKPITMVVPYEAGGNLDLMARLVAPDMSKSLGQTIVIENRSGAGGMIGHGYVAQMPPDGYTLVVTANGSYAVTPRLVSKPSFKPSDFASVGSIAVSPLILEVPESSKFKTIGDFLTYAQAHPQGISIGHSGNGTSNQVAILELENATGVQLNVIPYKGSAPALSDLLGHHIDAMVDQLSSSLPLIRAGKLRPLAVTVPKRIKELPNIPSLAEHGIKGFDVSTTTGILVPAKTPTAVIDKLNHALNVALADPQVQARLKQLGTDADPSTAAQFQTFLDQEDAKAAQLFKTGQLKMQ